MLDYDAFQLLLTVTLNKVYPSKLLMPSNDAMNIVPTTIVSEAKQVSEATTAKNVSDVTEKNKAENTNESDALATDKSDFVRIASEVNDEFCKEDEENLGEEMVIIFGEYNHPKPFDEKTYFGEMKEKKTSYFHYDGDTKLASWNNKC